MMLDSLDGARSYDHVYVAPHPDDAVLSCGGQIAQQTASGETVLVVTICAGSPGTEDELTPYAQHLHRTYGLGADPMAGRRAEDAGALRVLGCDGLQLDQLDAPYRMASYGARAAVFGPPAPDDPLVPASRDILSQLRAQQPSARLYLPLGVGSHVDHQILYAVGLALAERGANVVWYEDAPYAVQREQVEQRLGELDERFEPVVVPIGASLERKLAAIAMYGSQLPKLFRTAPMEQVMAEYAAAVAGETGQYGERLWRLA